MNSIKTAEMKGYSSSSSAVVKIMWAGGAMSGILALCSLFACAPTLQPKVIDLSGSVSSDQIQSLLTNSNSGILAYWKFEEAAGGTVTGGNDFADASGLSNSLKIQAGTCVYGQTGTDGKAIQTTALTAATTATAVTTATSEFSFGAWVKWNGTTPGSSIPFLANGNGTTNGYGLIMNDGNTIAAGNKVSLYVPGVSFNAITTASAPTLVSGSWTHFFVTRSGSTWTLYVNGTMYGTGTAAVPVAPTTHTGIGAFPGLMDDVTFWNSALSSDEISTLYLVQSGTYGL